MQPGIAKWAGKARFSARDATHLDDWLATLAIADTEG
jgi:hypothetical protein